MKDTNKMAKTALILGITSLFILTAISFLVGSFNNSEKLVPSLLIILAISAPLFIAYALIKTNKSLIAKVLVILLALVGITFTLIYAISQEGINLFSFDYYEAVVVVLQLAIFVPMLIWSLMLKTPKIVRVKKIKTPKPVKAKKACKLASYSVIKYLLLATVSLFIISIIVPFFAEGEFMGFVILSELAIIELEDALLYSLLVVLPSLSLLLVQLFANIKKESLNILLILLTLINAISLYVLTEFVFEGLTTGLYVYLAAFTLLLLTTILSFFIKEGVQTVKIAEPLKPIKLVEETSDVQQKTELEDNNW